MKLKGKTALITGASGKLGGQIAIALGQAGCDCVCHYNKNGKIAEDIAGQIRSASSQALAVQADLTKPQDIEKLFERACQLGTPQILINSAGLFSRQKLGDLTFEQTQEMLNLNLTAAILTSQAFAGIIEARFDTEKSVAGKIINIAGVGGVRAWAELTVYCASKAGLIAATKSLAKELAPRICVNCLAPGIVSWPNDYDELQKQHQLDLIPAKRIAEPAEICEGVIFLCKHDYITGQVLNIDGGRSI